MIKKQTESTKKQTPISFPIETYKFPDTCTNNSVFFKTDLNIPMGPQQISKVTKINHSNIIALKKIAKHRKSNKTQSNWKGDRINQNHNSKMEAQQLFTFYYQAIPFSLEVSLRKHMLNVKPQALLKTLEAVKKYLRSMSLTIKFVYENIGVSETGDIKIYIPIPQILEQRKTEREMLQCQKSLASICNWYEKKYSRNSQPSPKIKTSLSPNLNRNMEITSNTSGTLQSPSRTVSIPNFRDFQLVPKNRDKTRQLNAFENLHEPINIKEKNKKNQEVDVLDSMNKFMQQQNINCINIYHNGGRAICIDKQVQREKNAYGEKIQLPVSPQTRQHYYPNHNHEYETSSIDTYRMQLGDDHEMPQIGRQYRQRLRQTVLNRNNWETTSHHNKNTHHNTINKEKNDKISESAGYQYFQRIIEKNRKNVQDSEREENDIFDDREMACSQRETIFKRGLVKESISSQFTTKQKHAKLYSQQSLLRQKLPLRSDSYTGPDIQDRVKKALLKTKSVMNLLKNRNHQSAGK